jgi:prolyl-tRNA synthetase
MSNKAPDKAQKAQNAISPTRAEDFAGWYQEVVKQAEIAEMAHVRGCMVIRPWGYAIWTRLRDKLAYEIESRGHENVYFPLFIPLSYLQKEADHVEGFAKEMAVVTHHRLEQKDGVLVPAAPLEEPVVVRPTSEAIIGESMAKWVQSHRDLPMKLNQWANVVRWELRPRILLRTTEFLWQEGHTAHATEEEAMAETLNIHDMYRSVAEDWLAIPVIQGEKSPTERFPGAVKTFSIEAMMQDGKAVQAGTSHFLGQNFSKSANIAFLDEKSVRQFVYTTSWGVSTRLLGALVMSHADDDGLCVPPRVAPHQIVITPIVRGDNEADTATMKYVEELASALRLTIDATGQPLRVFVDSRPHRPIDKKWQWIKKGVPLLLEIGARDVERNVVTYRNRLDHKQALELGFDDFVAKAAMELNTIQETMFLRARARLEAGVRRDILTRSEAEAFFAAESNGFVLAKWCGSSECETALKHVGATIRCLPQEWHTEADRCLICSSPATIDALWGLSY